MARKIVLLSILTIISFAYCGDEGYRAVCAVEAVVRKCKALGRPMTSVLGEYPSAVVVTNQGVVRVRVINDLACQTFHYPLLEIDHPRMVAVRDDKGSGYDAHLNGRGGPTKYIEYKDGRIHGLWLEFFPNATVRAHMTLTNDCFVGRQMYYDETGKLISEGHLSGSIYKVPLSIPKSGIRQR